jgi:hypothetical protein
VLRLDCLDGDPEALAGGSSSQEVLPEVVLYCQLLPSPEGFLQLREANDRFVYTRVVDPD